MRGEFATPDCQQRAGHAHACKEGETAGFGRRGDQTDVVHFGKAQAVGLSGLKDAEQIEAVIRVSIGNQVAVDIERAGVYVEVQAVHDISGGRGQVPRARPQNVHAGMLVVIGLRKAAGRVVQAGRVYDGADAR